MKKLTQAEIKEEVYRHKLGQATSDYFKKLVQKMEKTNDFSYLRLINNNIQKLTKEIWSQQY
jgi:hypothetical protein